MIRFERGTHMLAWIIPVSVVGGIVVILLLAVVIWWIATNNKFKRYAVKIDEAASGIDVALTKRYDLLSKSVEVVKGYAKHEAETIMKGRKLSEPQGRHRLRRPPEPGQRRRGAAPERPPDL